MFNQLSIVWCALGGSEILIPDIINRFNKLANRRLEFGVQFGFSTTVFANYFNEVIGIFTGDTQANLHYDKYSEMDSN